MSSLLAMMVNKLTEAEKKEISELFFREMLYLTTRHGLTKYGPIAEYMKTHPKYDHITCLISRLGKYLETGDRKFLVDVANFAMFEYKHPLSKIQK